MKITKVGLGDLTEAYIEDSFSDGINIIFSDDNNKGKTIVIQAILYAIGNKPIFPGSFDYKNYYYYLEFEENDNQYIVVRRGDSYIVSSQHGIRLFEDPSEFKIFWNANVFRLPQITMNGEQRMLDMELFSQLFFIGQDGKDTSTIFNPGFYHKDDFRDMIRSFAGDASTELTDSEVATLKSKIKELQAKRKEQLKLCEFYKDTTPAKEYISRIQDQDSFRERVRRMEDMMQQISQIRKLRSRIATQKSLWTNTLKELRSLNRTIEVGELRCMDCNSNHIAYKGQGKITYSFDVSTPEMRTQIISSIEDRIVAYKDEIERFDYEISVMQEEIEEIMSDEDITIENVLAYKNGISSIAEIEEIVDGYDKTIRELQMKVESGIQQSEESKKAREAFYSSILERMNEVKKKIDTESDQTYEDIFTKRGSVISGSEETVYYLARLISIAELTGHTCPIIMDSFRAEDLSTDKEDCALDLLAKLDRQCILTTTLKIEETGKYTDDPRVNAIDYSEHQSNKLLSGAYCDEFGNLLKKLGVDM